ncbi:hypothetical protein [Kordiimonas pumila]|uniref:TPM domain-containing protein n=1 Tax=Kordiimonas pumila TaxID=2161677 RepID=A0ABV7D0J5_9PROT|nr:hypothetical protein [Kordiimonas pumila]
MRRSTMKLLFTTQLFLVAFIAGPAHSQVETSDPRQLALDIYTGINREMPVDSIAIKLQQVIEIFRYRCNRVTDYQVYTLRPNLTDLKVKCSGDPLYGVTVASNGYVSVFGGNGILSGLDRRDAIIYSFGSEGELAFDSSLTVGDALEETMARVELGDEYNYIYLFGMFMMILAIMLMGSVVFFRAWRRKTGRKPRQRMRPMQKHRVSLSSSMKDQMFQEATEVSKFVRKHPSGVYIAVGKRGKRRLFNGFLWAKVYAVMGVRFFETSAPDEFTDHHTDQSVN